MTIQANINKISDLIKQAERQDHRTPGSVMIMAVSKQQPASAIKQCFHYGITNFGENYLQEAEKKILELKELPLIWHFIGPVQSNKAKNIAQNFDWVHSVDRLKIAQLLSQHRQSSSPPVNLCLQINLVHEESKSGIPPEQAQELAVAVQQLPKVNLRGLMTIPPPLNTDEDQYQLFLKLQVLMQSINKQTGLQMDTLSMGMSDDFLPAIKAGATIVRIGRAIFGQRLKHLQAQ